MKHGRLVISVLTGFFKRDTIYPEYWRKTKGPYECAQYLSKLVDLKKDLEKSGLMPTDEISKKQDMWPQEETILEIITEVQERLKSRLTDHERIFFTVPWGGERFHPGRFFLMDPEKLKENEKIRMRADRILFIASPFVKNQLQRAQRKLLFQKKWGFLISFSYFGIVFC